MQSHELFDVTLVCEDKTKFKAHQFVMYACSPVFQSIINDLPHKDPVIYLTLQEQNWVKRSSCSRNEINFTIYVSWTSSILSGENE